VNILSVVIPALNEENGIADIVERVLSVQPALAQAGVAGLELIVVDDGSHDRTADIVAGYPDVVLVKHPVNKGYGAAIKTGFQSARGNLLAFLDADGTYPPEYFPNLCRPILHDGADLVIGSRMAGANSEMPLVRRIGNTIFATLVSIISNHRVTDSASGQRVLRKDRLAHLYPLPDGLNFTPVMTTRAMHEHIRVVEVPIPYSERVGRSKLSVVRDGYRFLQSILMTALTYNPVRIFGLSGVGLVLLGMLVAATSVAAAQASSRPDARFAALFGGLVLAAAGVNIFAIGATFNYVVSLFHKRQIRQGLLGRPIFGTPLETRFGWIGLASIIVGVIIYGLAVALQLTASGLAAPWFAPAVSAILVLSGLHLVTSWLLVVLLAELSKRETRAGEDLGAVAPALQNKLPAVETARPLPL
jgi:hypothetical protein